MDPILLPANQPAGRFYQGGTRISEFRRTVPSPPHTPEDWVGSTTSVRGNPPLGMTRLDDGRLLIDAIHEDPIGWLGTRHLDAYGEDTMLLVKLLDAGQRLPVHAHPDTTFARRHISASHGKAEAWYILTPGVVHLALRDSAPLDELRSLVDAQDSDAMLALMHTVIVEPGDCVFVPHGVLHSIGAGILLAEVQEPEDLSILLEWKDFDLDGANDGHLGIGFDLALTAVETTGRTPAEVEALVRRGVEEGDVLPDTAGAYFRLDRVATATDFPAGFGVVIALDDSARITLQSGSELALPAGSTALMPHAAGSFHIEGTALIARPPHT